MNTSEAVNEIIDNEALLDQLAKAQDEIKILADALRWVDETCRLGQQKVLITAIERNIIALIQTGARDALHRYESVNELPF